MGSGLCAPVSEVDAVNPEVLVGLPFLVPALLLRTHLLIDIILVPGALGFIAKGNSHNCLNGIGSLGFLSYKIFDGLHWINWRLDSVGCRVAIESHARIGLFFFFQRYGCCL